MTVTTPQKLTTGIEAAGIAAAEAPLTTVKEDPFTPVLTTFYRFSAQDRLEEKLAPIRTSKLYLELLARINEINSATDYNQFFETLPSLEELANVAKQEIGVAYANLGNALSLNEQKRTTELEAIRILPAQYQQVLIHEVEEKLKITLPKPGRETGNRDKRATAQPSLEAAIAKAVRERLEGPLTHGCRTGDILEVTQMTGFNLDDEGSPMTTYFHGGDQTDLPLNTKGELVSIDSGDHFTVKFNVGETERVFSLHPTEVRNTGENTYLRYIQQFGQDPVALSKAIFDEAETALKARHLAMARERINREFDQKAETILTSLVNTFNLTPEQLAQIRAGEAFEYQIPVVEETTARLPFRELGILMVKMMEYHQEVKVDLPKELKHLDGKPLTEAQFKVLVVKSAAKIKKPLEELVQTTARSTADLLSKQHYLKGREFRIRDERKDILNGVFEYLLKGEGESPIWLRRLMLYNDRPIFRGGDPFAPPSEELVRVVKLETGGGCNYAKCTFCTEYAKAEFFFRDPKSFQEHAQEVRRKLGADLAYIQRVFLSGGDTFSLPTETLLAYLKTVNKLFDHQRVKSPDHGEFVRTAIRRVEAFTRTEGILTKSEGELDQLRRNNLTLLYWGAETGSDAVLQYVNKGITRAEMDKAVDKIRTSGINVSVMIMPGLGGIAHYEDHVRKTVEVLNRLHPRYTTFHTVTPKPHTVYARKMAGEMQQGTNRPLTDEEVVEQMHDIVSGMRDGYTSLVATYYPPSAKIAINPVSFRGYLHRGGGKEGILNELRNYFTEEGHTPSAALEQRDFNKNSRIRKLVQ